MQCVIVIPPHALKEKKKEREIWSCFQSYVLLIKQKVNKTDFYNY